MKLEISHRTTYSYKLPVAQSHHLLHLRPRALPTQSVVNHSLLIEPAPVYTTDIIDYFGNVASLLRIEEQHIEFVVHSRSTVIVTPAPLPNLDLSHSWERVRDRVARGGPDVPVDVVQFASPSRQTPSSPAILEFARTIFQPDRPVLVGAMALTRLIYETFAFDATATDVSTPVEKVLRTRRGVCQDFSHLALATLRALGLPARYVSGYLLTQPPPGQAKLKGADASHAWLSVWTPEHAWVDFDPTNGVIPKGEHVTVAFGRDYEDISPISGVLLGGGEQTMAVAVDVEPVN